MKRNFIIIISTNFLIITLFILIPVGNCEKINENTLYVGGIGNGNYSKIQDAIDNASVGDTVFVFNGTYNESVFIHITLDPSYRALDNPLVTTKLLGRAKIPDAAYENANRTWLKVDVDYFGEKRRKADPSAGPFEGLGEGKISLKIW